MNVFVMPVMVKYRQVSEVREHRETFPNSDPTGLCE